MTKKARVGSSSFCLSRTIVAIAGAVALSAGVLVSTGIDASASDLRRGPVTSKYMPEAPDSRANPWYVSIFGGGNFITGDVDYSNGITTVQTDFDGGFTLGGAIGRKWDNGGGGLVARTELEFNYSENSVDTIDFSGNGVGQEMVAAGSQASAVGILANLFFDAEHLLGDRVTPYFGGGVGVNIINHNLLYNGGLNLNDDDDVVFAWHVTGGLKFAINETASFFTDVGFHQAVDTSSIRRNGAATLVGAGGGRFEDDINSVVVKAGVTVGF